MMNTIQTESSLTARTELPKRSRSNPWRVGLVGAGYVAEWHAKALAMVDGVELLAVCDRLLERARQCAAAFGIPAAYSSLEEMLRSQALDAVHILVPPERHFETAMAALEGGVHVLLEKPMCTTPQECERLVTEAARRGLRLGVGHNFLFHKAYEQLRRDVREGWLGRIDEVVITWSRELLQASRGPFDIWMLRQPENIMLEIGPHSVGHMLDLVGRPELLEVRAGNRTELPSGMPFYRRWLVHAERGTTVVALRFSFVPGFAEHSIHVRGSLASATADLERNTYLRHEHTAHDDELDRYAMIRREARCLRRQGWRNLRDYALATLKLSRSGNAYAASIAAAAAAFYAGIGGELDNRISPEMGQQVVALCQRIARQAGVALESAPESCAASAAMQDSPRVLVLGATGFIGRELVRQLTDEGHAVRVLVRNPTKLPADVRGPGIQVVLGDLSCVYDIDRALEGIEVVYHLARPMVKTWADYQKYEVDITRQLAEQCLAARVRRLIYTGTIASYYAGRKAGVITEHTPLDLQIDRRDYYARAKAASEQILMQMYRDLSLPLVIVRPGIVIGRGGSPFHWGVGMWRYGSICQIWGDGNHKLPLVLVQDVARGLVLAMKADGIIGESFNLVGDPCLSAQEYLDELEKAGNIRLQRIATPIYRFYASDMLKWMVKVLLRHPDRRRPSYHDWESRTHKAVFDCSRAKQRLGWRPVTDRDEFIRLGIVEPVREMMG